MAAIAQDNAASTEETSATTQEIFLCLQLMRLLLK